MKKGLEEQAKELGLFSKGVREPWKGLRRGGV